MGYYAAHTNADERLLKGIAKELEGCKGVCGWLVGFSSVNVLLDMERGAEPLFKQNKFEMQTHCIQPHHICNLNKKLWIIYLL